MCGIAGIIAKEKSADLLWKIKEMTDEIIHRGPDGSGIKCFDDKTAFGHRRLSIIDLSDDGKQPMNYKDRYWITFNGEIYNYLELKENLKNAGYMFSNNTDTEVILAAYDKWGKECVEHFNGMWAFAIYDEEKREVFCSRDRFGIKPFYYMEEDGKFYFASEIKQLLTQKKEIKANREMLEAYLEAGVLDYTEQTMFSGINQLSGGFNLCFDVDAYQYTILQWYELEDVKENTQSLEENIKNFRENFFHSVGLRLRADVTVGSCLSGGLDSSAIVCVMHQLLENMGKEEKQFTVSSCFEDKRYDEREYINEVVKHTGVQSYRTFPDMSKLFEELDTIIWHMDEPFGSTSIYAQWNVFREAKKQGLTVMLDGQGADEQLAGYTEFYRVLFIELLKKGKIKEFYREIRAYKELRASTEVTSLFKHIITVLSSCLPEKIEKKLKAMYKKELVSSPFPKEFQENRIVKSAKNLYNVRNARQYIHASMKQGMQSLLHYEDRNSMAHSVESRVPFLDCKLVEGIYATPFRMKIQKGRTKYIMREALKDILPSAIYERYSKLGFVTPEDQWMKENKDFFEKELAEACDVLQSLLDKRQVLHWYRDNIANMKRGNFTVWRIICAAHWMKIFHVVI